MDRLKTRTPAFAKQKYAGFGVASETKKSSEAIFLYKRAEERSDPSAPRCYNKKHMETIYIVAVIFVVIAIVFSLTSGHSSGKYGVRNSTDYQYARKDAVMTQAEAKFYNRLLSVAGDRYYIFPQIHLSSLLTNQTKGRYWKAAFQRINRTSVDYVLCDKQTMRPVYAVELDDATHDAAKRHARDEGVNKMFKSVNMPLVRFRNVEDLTDQQIIDRFADAAENR